jgi:N-acetylglutamate synthase-like GNAT family acetyltransferase
MAAWSTRAARPADLAQLRCLLADSCDTAAIPSSALLADAIERELVRVAESEGEPVACIVAEMPSPGHARLSVIAVRAGMRQQGVASQLLTEMVRELPLKSSEPPLISAVAKTE